MYFFYLPRFVPRRVRTVARFAAADPWQLDLPTEFSIEAYRYVPQDDIKPPRQGPEAAEVYGLRSEIDGRERLLPDALSHLWKRGELPAEELPALLRDLRPRLVKSDYRPLLAIDARRRWWMLALVLAGCAVAYVALAPGGAPPLPGRRFDVTALRLHFLWQALGFVAKVGTAVFAGCAVLVAYWRSRRRRQIAWALDRRGRPPDRAPGAWGELRDDRGVSWPR